MMYTEVYAEVRRLFLKWKRAPMWVFGGLMSPILYLVLFGQAFNLGNLIPSAYASSYLDSALLGAPSYFSYFAVGMIGFSGVTSALFSGVNIQFDKSLGIMSRTVATSAKRSSIFAGYLIFQAILTLVPSFLVIGIALILGYVPGFSGLTVSASQGVTSVFEIVVAIILLCFAFTSLFLAFGFSIKKQESYFGVVTLLQLPILLTSSAMYPSTTMPVWLKFIVSVNPISLSINAVRENMFGASFYPYGPQVYLAGLVGWCAILVSLSLIVAYRSFRVE